MHITSNLTGHEAAKAARAALGALGALQTEAEAKDEAGKASGCSRPKVV